MQGNSMSITHERDPAKTGSLFINYHNNNYMDNKKWHFTNQNTGKQEEVALEKWIWGVVYKDDTEFHQFQDDFTFHRMGEVDQSRVKLWVLYQPGGKGNGRIDFVVPEGAKLIHKYRNIVLNAGTEDEVRHRIYIFGYKMKGGQSHYNFVMPNGTIVQSTEENPQLSKFIQ